MKSFSNEMSERFMGFVVKIIAIENELCKTYSGRHIYGQLFRSGTSTGANFEEARSGESKADFIHKLQIVLKELRESHYWIQLIIAAQFIPARLETLKSLSAETKELANITAKSIVTAKLKSSNEPIHPKPASSL